MTRTTVCALLYGDYPDLARRCLTPIARLLDDGRIELRLGMNECSPETFAVVRELLKCDAHPGAPTEPYHFTQVSADRELLIEAVRPQLYKYPMMRRLFTARPLTTEFVMWFDDDSYIKNADPGVWLTGMESLAEKTDMIGSVYSIKIPPQQRAWIERQPWYAGKPVPISGKFATGGWWVLRSELIRQYNWPLEALRHRGGDVMLGQLLLQKGLSLTSYNAGVAINADAEGRESKSVRRGFDEPPIGT